jgi:hypothetical protein
MPFLVLHANLVAALRYITHQFQFCDTSLTDNYMYIIVVKAGEREVKEKKSQEPAGI